VFKPTTYSVASEEGGEREAKSTTKKQKIQADFQNTITYLNLNR
jgi:hypothetical protein